MSLKELFLIINFNFEFLAILVERKKSSPIIFHNEEQTLTEAGLFIHPITYDDYGRQPSDEEQHLDDNLNDNTDVNNNLEAESVEQEINSSVEVQTSSQDLNVDDNQADAENVAEESTEKDEARGGFDVDMQRKIEEMIESVISSAREEVDWMKTTNEDVEEIAQEPIIESDVTVEVSQPDEPPLPPPRRKSTTVDDSSKGQTKAENLPAIHEGQTVQEDVEVQQEVVKEPEVVREVIPASESKPDEMFSQLPNRLHLSNLEIDNLSVCSLQAGRIVSSEIESNTIVTNELECKSSHNLSNTKSIEFPPGFIEEIVERVRSAERAENQAAVQTESVQQQKETPKSQKDKAEDNDAPPARPPLPVHFDYSEFTSAVPPSFYQLRDFSEEEAVTQPQTHRRRRHQKRKDSTSEEDYQREHRSKSRGGASGDQSILSLGGQFARACGNALRDSGGQLMEILRASSKDENKRDLHIAIIILIIIVAGLVLMGMGEKPVHHHHWDFFNPPDNHGR